MHIAWSTCFPGFTHSTHCAYPDKVGQVELTWVADYILRWFICPQTVTYPISYQLDPMYSNYVNNNNNTTMMINSSF